MENRDLWEQKYRNGHDQKYPWDEVVSFVNRYAPKQTSETRIRILELGCGTGANLKFIAEQGYEAYGIEQSSSAVKIARSRLAEFAFSQKNLVVGNFVDLPFPDNFFDLIIDRASLCCVGLDCFSMSLNEVHRTLKRNGFFYSQTYGSDHLSAKSGNCCPDGLTREITEGSLKSAGNIRFSNAEQILESVNCELWDLRSFKRKEVYEMHNNFTGLHQEYILIASKR